MFCLDLGNEENVLWFIGGHGRMSVVGVGKYRSYQSVMTWGYMRIFTVQKLRPNESSALWNPVIVLGWYLHPPAVQAQDAAFMLAFDAEASLFPMAVSVRYSVATMWNAQQKTEVGTFSATEITFLSQRNSRSSNGFLNFPWWPEVRFKRDSSKGVMRKRCSCQVPDLYWGRCISVYDIGV